MDSEYALLSKYNICTDIIIQACTEIRKLENGTFHHAIIALTANVLEGILDDCKAKGMDDVISKPIDFKQLSAVLCKYLSPAKM